jgi:hypothetical protein
MGRRHLGGKEDNVEERADQEMWDPHVRNMEFAEWCHFVA